MRPPGPYDWNLEGVFRDPEPFVQQSYAVDKDPRVDVAVAARDLIAPPLPRPLLFSLPVEADERASALPKERT